MAAGVGNVEPGAGETARRIPGGRLWLRADGVACVVFDAAVLGLEVNEALRAEIPRLRPDGGRVPIVVDIRAVRLIDPMLRRRSTAGPDNDMLLTRLALVVGNALTRAIATLFARAAVAKIPIIVCTDVDEALAWAREGRDG